jgi:hypothetical protein
MKGNRGPTVEAARRPEKDETNLVAASVANENEERAVIALHAVPDEGRDAGVKLLPDHGGGKKERRGG